MCLLFSDKQKIAGIVNACRSTARQWYDYKIVLKFRMGGMLLFYLILFLLFFLALYSLIRNGKSALYHMIRVCMAMFAGTL